MDLDVINILYKVSFITVLLAVLLLLSLLFIVVLYTPQYIRTRQLKKVANKYNLRLRNAFSFSMKRFFIHVETQNILEGTVQNRPIKIYDSFNPNGLVWQSGLQRNRLSIRVTKIEYDGQTLLVRGGTFGFARVKDIEKLLKNITHNRPYEDFVSENRTSIAHVPYLPLFIIVVTIGILIKLFS